MEIFRNSTIFAEYFSKALSTSKLNDILSKLLQIGYTSGFDTLLGICTGVYYLIHGTYGADV